MQIVQLDITKVKVLGETNGVLIILSSNSKFFQIIDIMIDDIPEFCNVIDWSKKLHGYFTTNWSHLWLPCNNKPNQIRVDSESHMKYYVTNLDEENESISFTNNILGNYSLEYVFGSFTTQCSHIPVDYVSSQIEKKIRNRFIRMYQYCRISYK